MNLLLESGSAIKKAKEKFFADIVRQFHLTSIELTVLLFLNYSNFDTATDIVNELFIAKSHVSLSVNLLNTKGYIQKVQDKEDRKITHLKLTKKTEEIFKITNEKIKSLEERLFEGLTEEDKINMERIFDIFYGNIRNLIGEGSF